MLHLSNLYASKARHAMSIKTRTIVFSLAALLAAAGGIYAFTPDNQGSVAGDKAVEASAQTPEPAAAASQNAVAEPVDQKTTSQPGEAAAKQPAQPASQAPKKLTREQLMPPPMTEAEKLDKVAQQESNF
jgi:hypothetical protein